MSEGRKFPARYPGRCPACRERIEVDEDLIYNDDEVVVHYGCANRSTMLAQVGKPAEVCPRCFIEKSTTGVCGCDE